MDAVVSAHLHETLDQPFVWGQSDCAMWCAGLVKRATGRDPAADLRGTYASRFEYRAIAIREGGLLAMARKRMAFLHPLGATGVALIRLDGTRMFAVIAGGRAVVRTDAGHRIVDTPRVIEGWSWSRP